MKVVVCDVCEKSQNCTYDKPIAEFVCSCGNVWKIPDDNLIITDSTITTNSSDLYDKIFYNIVRSRNNTLVAMDCEKCGLNFKHQIVIGDQMDVVFVCECEYQLKK